MTTILVSSSVRSTLGLPHMSENTQYLAFTGCLLHLAYCPSVLHMSPQWQDFNLFVCVHFLYPSIHKETRWPSISWLLWLVLWYPWEFKGLTCWVPFLWVHTYSVVVQLAHMVLVFLVFYVLFYVMALLLYIPRRQTLLPFLSFPRAFPIPVPKGALLPGPLLFCSCVIRCSQEWGLGRCICVFLAEPFDCQHETLFCCFSKSPEHCVEMMASKNVHRMTTEDSVT